MTDPDALKSLLESLPNLPHQKDAPIFREPWEARLFAMTLAAHEAGLFSWSEWADTLGAEIKRAGAADTGADYYHHWLTAFETLVSTKGAASEQLLRDTQSAWDKAAKATPHGEPIVLGQ